MRNIKNLRAAGLTILVITCFLFANQSFGDGHDGGLVRGEKVMSYTGTLEPLMFEENRNIGKLHVKRAGNLGEVFGTSTFYHDGSNRYTERGIFLKQDGTVGSYSSEGTWETLQKNGNPIHSWKATTILTGEAGHKMIDILTFDATMNASRQRVTGEAYEMIE